MGKFGPLTIGIALWFIGGIIEICILIKNRNENPYYDPDYLLNDPVADVLSYLICLIIWPFIELEIFFTWLEFKFKRKE
ncbi:hypothetical protein M0R36_10805 [bacterium]|jgi:hypothetical protein|nr:hypothetical protein [bacterium]